MVQIEFLNTLYKCKVEAEQELEKLKESVNTPLPEREAEWLIRIRNIKIKNSESLVSQYTKVIQSYILMHNNR